MDDHAKLSLPDFLKIFTSNNVPIQRSMTFASKLYKEYNTRATLEQLSEIKLKAAGLESSDDCKQITSALRNAGYACKGEPMKKVKVLASISKGVDKMNVSKTSKRKRNEDKSPNEPSTTCNESANLEFNEVLNGEILRAKSTVINRAPIMMAWATIVAERLLFSREEALSIASVYTEMNAVSKGVSLGFYTEDQNRGREALKNGSQPYVELMGRRPLYRNQNGQWRALSNGNPISPISAFSYISRSLRQTTPYIIGALKLLANSYPSTELNEKAWALYAQFRPEVNNWGMRSKVCCSTILDLCSKVEKSGGASYENDQTQDPKEQLRMKNNLMNEEPVHYEAGPEPKRAKTLTVEEYEQIMDQDSTFDNVDLDIP